jgi:hypothetical protein
MLEAVCNPATGESAGQAPAAQSDVIWQNVTVGMTRDQIRELYPDNNIRLIAACEAELDFDYERGVVTDVNLKNLSESQPANCRQIVFRSLTARYGQPDSRQLADHDAAMPSINPDVAETGSNVLEFTATWNEPNLLVQFAAIGRDQRGWAIRYTPQTISPETDITPDAADQL